MKLGSEAHKQLLCQSFIETHQEYEPEHLPFPHLNDEELARLHSIPFWPKALDMECEAGAMVNAFAQTVEDLVIKDAIALQGYEETRHARLIQTLINRYNIEMSARPPVIMPPKIEPAFTTFGFGECLDSFFAFGLFGIAREAKVFPEQIFAIFDPILDSEAVSSLKENARRMSKFDPQLLQPQFIPTLCKIALGILQLIPQCQSPKVVESINPS